ncbi:ADP-ribose pyrophosphatase YjhB (NUDIX family) [Clostridium saccharoperbutylacetonicum]|uniref:ADP-ribose pyrophosphatase n=1 Tax=Clostridium saccharoperbutylacetonicum N1-4(HMT) TaxID=931276 RepID=M1MUE8_9CLOT|nr:NUDIX hydrolase [Clostridium saccharoperbutylacetonicum]AGF58291.1 ADP-ribose pyrophosphatase [Clostridium saccharoperbutylacetonicum N1-4(HMT)]NRT60932.1 ADP-ribose pyrophosphatase YjhB (NUDIX family) [Clostridium saccharoperbutylacetonicum]NSB24245.1 ADP-ribose pyrophosphatase YjhB (NUDIX family) [Clostridium saccharoperbutylacetonicum]NSB43623.1 ADP-ribose pyrophosphatase YjhB (NUDIX family) [Clostridium saccharoperbutylacetonicum]
MDKLLDLAVELQFIAQAGLTYSENSFDRDRFQRIREISAEIMSSKSELTLEKVKDLFCSETGYQTPKIDTRAAIFSGEKILLVQETSSGEWSLPGGWVDVNQSIRTNVIKEVKEEAGLDVEADRIISILDRKKYNVPPYAYGVCKIFVLCNIIGGKFEANIETSDSKFFNLDELPTLSVERNTKKQIEICFEAYKDKNWKVLFD